MDKSGANLAALRPLTLNGKRLSRLQLPDRQSNESRIFVEKHYLLADRPLKPCFLQGFNSLDCRLVVLAFWRMWEELVAFQFGATALGDG
ncbi:MAG: hypothetical protein JWR14_6130 [Caballeronia sp.]|jgi:hypothetical protein|nr:hypothetical protein [Caballeronia mineralivorans]MDB5836300.1 hypothetical protein [Caballeronia sp.]